MSRRFWKRWLWTGALAAAALPATASITQGDEPAPSPPPAAENPTVRLPLRILLTQRDGEAVGEVVPQYHLLADQADPEPLPTSDYWIGVGLDPELSPIVMEQLGLKHGLTVADAFPDSPAAKAGIKQHDILTIANGKALAKPADLIHAVDEAKETELSIVLLRGGKEMTIKVTPTKRPQPDGDKVEPKADPQASPEVQAEIKRLDELLQSLKARAGANGPLALSFVHPPIVARADVFKPAEFPKDLTVQITKQGENPATIKVKQGDKEWEVTEDKVGELPTEVRMHVEMFRGRALRMRSMAIPPQAGAAPHAIRVTPEGKIEGEIRVTPPGLDAQHFREVLRQPHGPQNIDTKLDAILKKLDHMENKAIEELQHEVKELRKELDEVRGKSTDEQPARTNN